MERNVRRVVVTLSAVAVTAAGVLTGLGPRVGGASSHREAPLVSGDPQVDTTDVYAFVSPDNPETVTLIANWIPFQEPNGGPNFYPWGEGVHYDFNIDNDGDAQADITYRWTFKNQDNRGTDTFLYNNGPVTSLNDETLLFKQTYTLEEIRDGGKAKVLTEGTAAPSNLGPASMPDYAALRDEAITSFGDGGMTWAGQADDPFFVDLRVFDLLYGTDLSEVGQDTLAGFNVSSIALQVPKTDLALNGDADGNPVIGIWSSTERQTLQLAPGTAKPTGEYVQVSRLGNPLVNEVVVPSGLKDAFNSLTPDVDHTIDEVVERVTDPELPKLIDSIYGVPAPATPREDLVEIFLTGICKACGPIAADLNSQQLNKDVKADAFVPSEMLRLNMSIAPAAEPNRLGVLAEDLQGFPNGRRLTDDVLDIAVQAVEGAAQSGEIVEALAAGDAVDENDATFEDAFPYVALPHSAAVTEGADEPEAEASPAAAATSDEEGSGGLIAVIVALAVLLTGAIFAMIGMRRRGGAQ
jgi:hypothetical protein